MLTVPRVQHRPMAGQRPRLHAHVRASMQMSCRQLSRALEPPASRCVTPARSRRERPGAWRATPPACSCATTRPGGGGGWGPNCGRFRPPAPRATPPRRRAAVSPGVGTASPRPYVRRSHGGPATLSNLARLCTRSPRRAVAPEEGYAVEREPDGALRFQAPGWPADSPMCRRRAASLATRSASCGARHEAEGLSPAQVDGLRQLAR